MGCIPNLSIVAKEEERATFKLSLQYFPHTNTFGTLYTRTHTECISAELEQSAMAHGLFLVFIILLQTLKMLPVNHDLTKRLLAYLIATGRKLKISYTIVNGFYGQQRLLIPRSLLQSSF
jgi:hypothetical protein